MRIASSGRRRQWWMTRVGVAMNARGTMSAHPLCATRVTVKRLLDATKNSRVTKSNTRLILHDSSMFISAKRARL